MTELSGCNSGIPMPYVPEIQLCRLQLGVFNIVKYFLIQVSAFIAIWLATLGESS
jgi:hypothetical protein